MATIRKRFLKTGAVVFDIQVKVKDVNLQKMVIKTTTFRPDDKFNERQQERECLIFAQKFEKDMKNLYAGTSGESLDYNITFATYSQKWLERIKKDFSISYYTMNIEIIKWANKYIGGYKIKDITPFILQDFYDKLDSLKREIIVVNAKPELRDVMNERNIKYKNFRYDYKINSGSLAHALSGKNISLTYAKSMAKILNVDVNKVFNITKTEQYYSPATISKFKRAVRCVFAMAKRQRLIEHNYASADYISYGKKPQRNIVCLDDKEAKELFRAIMRYQDIRAKTAILILLLTGMRRGELVGLEWKDIDYDKNTISISRTGAYCKSLGIYTKEPKTAGSIRIITVSEIVIKQLKEYQEWYNSNKANWGDRWIDSGRLFVQEHGEPICPSTIRFWLNKLLTENGMPHITVHSLRHTNITMQIAAGVPLVTVAGRAGHSRTSTTTDIYSHFIKSSDQYAAEVLEDIFVKNKKN